MRSRGGALRRVFGRGAAAFLVLGTPTCLGVLRHLGDTNDSVSLSDLEAGGSCEDGCVRAVVNAQAQGVGEVDCALRVQNLLDHYDADVVGSALNVVHSCTNEEGDLLYEGQGACLYSVCVTAEWRAGTIFYSVVVEHDTPVAEHTVLVQVYLNEYEDLVHVPDVSFASSAPTSSVQCQLGTTCPAASDCGTDGVSLTILLEDDYGDGWVDALPDRANSWALTQALSASELASPVADGTLPDRHYSGAYQLCLEDGLYTFSTTADATWSEESSWTVCGVTGGAGGALELQIGGGGCSVVDDSSAGGPPEASADTPTEDVCSMPTESPCVSLDVDLREISGPAVGMYYDEACLEGGGGETGCGGGGEPACRVCFVNRDFWLEDFADERYPDWVDCPCCVAAELGVTCQEGEPVPEPEESLLEQAEDFYWEGSAPLLAGLCGLIALGLITACCCCRDIRKTNQKALTFKHHKTSGYAGYNNGGDNTSPDVTPPSRDSHKRSGEFPAKHGENDDVDHGQDLEAVIVPTTKAKKKKNRPLSRGKPPRGGGGGGAQDDGGRIPADATDSPDLYGYGGDGTLAPRPPMTALPGAAKDRPPSDASWPSDPRVGVSVSGKKNPRWSGSKELKAYLRRTGYDEMGNEESHQQQQQQKQKQRRSGDKHTGGRGGGGGVVRALKKKGSSLLGEKKSSRNEFEWVDDAEQRPHAEAEIAAAPYPDDADGPAVSMGYIDGLGLGDESAVPPTGVVGGPKPRPKSRSRSRSRDRSHRRGGDVGGGSGGGRGAKKKSGGRARNAAPFEGSGSVSARSISSLLSAGSRSKPRRVAPTDDDEAAADGPNADELGLYDRSYLDKTWQVPPRVSEPEVQEDVTRRHDAPIASEVHRGRGAAGKSKNRGRGRGKPTSNVAVVMEDAVDSGRVKALKAERRREEEDKLRAEEARKRIDEEERAELERVREVRRREEEEEEERRRKKKQERLRRQQAEEQERIAAEQERTELAWQEQQQQQHQQQQQLEEEERSRRRRKQQSRQPHRNASREPDENGGAASRGRGRSADERKKRGDEGGSRDRRRGARGRSVEEAAAIVDPWDAAESNRAGGEGTRGKSREARDIRRGVSSSGRTQQPRGGGNTGRDGGDAPARGNSTPAGPRGSEPRESEAERRRRRSREAQERRPSQSRSQERQKGSRSRERRGGGSGSVPRGAPSSERRSSKSPKRGEVAEAAAPEIGRKKSGGTRFSSDPRAKQERAARLKEKRMKISAGQEN